MTRRREADAVDIELLDAGGPATPQPVAAEVQTPGWAWLAVAIAAVSVLLLIADRRPDDDPPPHDPEPSGLGIFELNEIDLADATPRDRVTYPLFGRTWDHDLVVLQQDHLVAVDLDTGEARVVADLGGVVETTRSFADVHAARGSLYLVASSGPLLRFDGDAAERIVGGAESGRISILEGWYLEQPAPNGRVTETTAHPFGGEEPMAIGPADFVGGVDDRLLIERAGTLMEIGTDGDDRSWPRGQILLSGRRTTIWRECDDDGCLAWVGAAGAPRSTALDHHSVLAVRGSHPSASLTSPRLVSPDGRLGWRQSDDLVLLDLADGSSVVFRTITGLPAFSPDATVVASTAGSIPTIVDLTTGEMARIRLPSAEGALRQNSVAFVPADALLLAR